MLEVLRRSLGVSSLEHTFANFEVNEGNEATHRAFLAMAQGDGRALLLCYGRVGNGKTHLCESLVLAWYSRGIFCRVLTMSTIMRILKSAMRPESGLPPTESILENYCRASRLIIDDVGMGGTGSAWEFCQLEEIIVYRYRERLPTVITTNRDLKELPERIVSRFYDPEVGCVVLNDAPDYRRR